MILPEGRGMKLAGLVVWTYMTIRIWCDATVDDFGGNAIFQVIVASSLLIVLQIAIVYGPSREDEGEEEPVQDREGDTNEC